MPRYPIKKDGKHYGFICGDIDLDLCADCAYPADNLCDFPVGEGKTCDRLMCDDHSHHVGRNLHYCEAHYLEWRAFVDNGGVSENLKNVIPFEMEKQKTHNQTHTAK